MYRLLGGSTSTYLRIGELKLVKHSRRIDIILQTINDLKSGYGIRVGLVVSFQLASNRRRLI